MLTGDARYVEYTRTCPRCMGPTRVRIHRPSFDRWMAGELIQDAAPELTAAERESLITGLHEECWEEMMTDE